MNSNMSLRNVWDNQHHGDERQSDTDCRSDKPAHGLLPNLYGRDVLQWVTEVTIHVKPPPPRDHAQDDDDDTQLLPGEWHWISFPWWLFPDAIDQIT